MKNYPNGSRCRIVGFLQFHGQPVDERPARLALIRHAGAWRGAAGIPVNAERSTDNPYNCTLRGFAGAGARLHTTTAECRRVGIFVDGAQGQSAPL